MVPARVCALSCARRFNRRRAWEESLSMEGIPDCKAHVLSRVRVRSNLRQSLPSGTSREGAKPQRRKENATGVPEVRLHLGPWEEDAHVTAAQKKRCRENSTREGPPKRSEHRETLLPPKKKRRSAQTGHLNQQRFVAQGLWEHARCRSTQYGLGGIQRLDTSGVSHAVGFRIFCAARF